MVKLLNINPLVEAMAYYTARANNNRIEKRLANAVNKFPEQKKALEKAAHPAMALEKLLDSKLKADEDLIIKFFKDFDNRELNSPFGYRLASLMVYFPLMTHLDYSADKFAEYLRGYTPEERIFSFCIGLNDSLDPLSSEKYKLTDISQRIEKLTISYENKWKILNAAVDYDNHLNELFSLLLPAVKIIEEAENKYKTAVDEFHDRCTEADLMQLCTPNKPKFELADETNIAPTILGFDHVTCMYNYKKDKNIECPECSNPSDCTWFLLGAAIGIAAHLVEDTSYNQVSQLSEKLKTLSDSTRLEMLFYLCSHRAYSQELSSKFGIHHSTVWYHVVKLKAAGLLTEELTGGKIYYTADKVGIQRIIDAFAEKIK